MTAAHRWMLPWFMLSACAEDAGKGTPQSTPTSPSMNVVAKAPEPADRTLHFYYGPMKPMQGEVILYSIAAFTGHSFGNFDFTAPDPGAAAFADAGNGAGSYYRHCSLFGGCMEHRIPLGRTSFVGTAYVLELERAATEACGDKAVFEMFPGNQAPTANTLVVDVVRHHYQRAFATEPTDVELEESLAYFKDHMAKPETAGLTPLESAGRGHCRALVTSNRFLYY
jgi:hypothetical protein